MEERLDMAQEAKPIKFKRKQYIVAKEFQMRYVGIILLFMFLTAALCSYVVYYTSMINLGEKLANVYPQGRLVSIVNIVNFRILLSVLLVTPLVAIIAIFLSHRIAGPIFRMEKFMDGIAAGNLGSRIVLRQGDELMTLADGINRLAGKLKSDITVQKASLGKILGEVDSLNKLLASKPNDLSAASVILNRLHNEVKELARLLDKYKV